ncbi:MAG: TonB-dependent receptor [Sphingomonadales bacterium]
MWRSVCGVAGLATVLVAAGASAEEPAAASPRVTTRLESISVYGEKTERSISQTSSSVSVSDERELRRRAAMETTGDVLDSIPNLVTTEPTNLAPAVRGIDGTGPAQGADAFFAGTRPRLNYQTDGRTLSFNEAIFSDESLWDVERVEVFRGPQSTLQGRNAIAGAIVVRTKLPTYGWEGAARVQGGSRETIQTSAAISGPIIDNQLAFRLAGDWRSSHSEVAFEPFPGVDDPGRYRSLALRGKLLFEPDALDGFRAVLTVSHLDAYAPQSADQNRPFGDDQAAFPRMPRFGTRATTGILDTSYEFSDAISLDVLASVADLRVNRWSDPGAGIAQIDGTEWVVEPRLRFKAGDWLTGFLGAHFFRNDQTEVIDLFGGGVFDDHTDTNAIFGEATAKFGQFEATFGGRWEREDRRRTGAVGPFVIDFDETYDEFLPKFSLAWNASEDLTVGVVASRGYNGGAAGFTYDPPFVSYTYDAEYVWNFEAFVRAQAWDDRVSIVGNVFYNRYKNMQLPFDLNPDPDIWSYVVRNADRAVTYGAELSTRVQVIEGLELFANFGLLKTEVTHYPGSGIEGNELARSPSFSTDFGLFYSHPIGLEVSADARYTDSYFTEVVNDPLGQVDPYWMVNAQVAWNFENVRVFVAVKNIFDSRKPVMLYPGAVLAEDTATVQQPRTVLAGVQAHF